MSEDKPKKPVFVSWRTYPNQRVRGRFVQCEGDYVIAKRGRNYVKVPKKDATFEYA